MWVWPTALMSLGGWLHPGPDRDWPVRALEGSPSSVHLARENSPRRERRNMAHAVDTGGDIPVQPVSVSRTGQLSPAFVSRLANTLWAGAWPPAGASSSAPLTLLVLALLGLASAEAEVSCNLSLPINLKMAPTCLESLADTLSRHICLSFGSFSCSCCTFILETSSDTTP